MSSETAGKALGFAPIESAGAKALGSDVSKAVNIPRKATEDFLNVGKGLFSGSKKRKANRISDISYTSGIYQDDLDDLLNLGTSFASGTNTELEGLNVEKLVNNADTQGLDYMPGLDRKEEYDEAKAKIERGKGRTINRDITQEELDSILGAFEDRQKEVQRARMMPGMSGAILGGRSNLLG